MMNQRSANMLSNFLLTVRLVGTGAWIGAVCLLGNLAAQEPHRDSGETSAIENAIPDEDLPELFPASTVPPIAGALSEPAGSSSSPAELHLPAIHHPWARFPHGAWREVEITTETFDEEGKLYGKSVTTQVEILKSVGEDSYSLDVQATVDISGKQINGEWNTRLLRLVNDRQGQILRSQEFEEETLQIGTREIPCQVLEVISSEEARNRTERIYYSPDHFPHILRRDVLESGPESPGELVVRDRMVVQSLSIPYYLGNRIVECSSTQTTRRQDKGSSVIVSFVTHEVPGGEVASWSSDFNASGQRVRWAVSRLVDHGLGEPAGAETRARPRIGRNRGGSGQ